MNMSARDRALSRSLPIIALALIAWLAPGPATRGAETVILGDLTFVNKALVGVGRLPSDLRDKFGETFGSGSAIAVDPRSWVRTPAGYQGTFYMLPDRGFNVTGTSDYRARINKLFITFAPLDDPTAVPIAQRQMSVAATLTDTILLTDAAGQSLTGLDPDGIRRAANGFPDLPQASNGHVSIDSESLALLPDGSFFIGDEYGPYVYRFSSIGRLQAAIRPPEAFLPKRKGKDHFASNNPGPGANAPEPPDPETGRANNQGFEGLTLTPRAANSWSLRCRARPARTAALRRKRGHIPGFSITTSPIASGRSSHASTSCRCRCTRPRAGNGGWPPRASCSRSTRRSSSCSAAMPAMVTAPAARPHATAASSSSIPRGRPTSQARATTAQCRSRPTASSRTGSCRRRSRATSTSTRRGNCTSSDCTTASRTIATSLGKVGRNDAGAGARSCQPERLLSVRHQ